VQSFLSAGVFGFSIRFGEIGVVVLEHFVLVAMAQLACERSMLGTAPGFRVGLVILYGTFAHSFVGTS
jgi:hypothetical protein